MNTELSAQPTHQRDTAIDIAKFFAALMVICIHIHPFLSFSEELEFFIVEICARQAVPFFAICTGYYIAGRLEFGDTHLTASASNLRYLWKRWKSIAILYLVWSALFFLYMLPSWHAEGVLNIAQVRTFIADFFTCGSHYHLWYLRDLLVFLPIAYLILRYIPKQAQYCILILFWLIDKCLLTPVPASFDTNFPHLSFVYGFLRAHSIILLPYILLGAAIRRGKEHTLRFNLSGLALATLALFIEAYAYKWHNGGHYVTEVPLIISTLPFGYFFFSALHSLSPYVKFPYAGMLGATSIFVYCFHPMLGDLPIQNHKTVIVFAGTILIGCLYYLAKRYIKQWDAHD